MQQQPEADLLWYEHVRDPGAHCGSVLPLAATIAINTGKAAYADALRRKSQAAQPRAAPGGHTPLLYGPCQHVPQCVHPLDGLAKYGWPKIRQEGAP